MKILVVEDDKPVGNFYQISLPRMILGAEVTLVRSAREGIQLLEEHPDTFTAVLTDYNTLDGVGTDVVSAASLRLTRRIVLATGQADDREFQTIKGEAVRRGATAVLRKPFGVHELIAALTVQR